MFDKKTLEEMQKAMQALQGMKSGISDIEAAMKQLQAMKQMGMVYPAWTRLLSKCRTRRL